MPDSEATDSRHPIRVGIVGASLSGGWALQSHLPALLSLPAYEVTAIATGSISTAQETAKHFGIKAFYASAEALADDADVDLVTVTVKVPDHRPAVEAAIAAGKDVYCEWPLAVDTSAAEELSAAAQARGIRTVIGLQARSAPAIRFMRDLIAEGFIGQVLAIDVSSVGGGLGGPVLAANREWAADEANGLSVLTVRAAHTLDAVQHCFGPITHMTAEARVAVPEVRIEGTGKTVRRTAPEQVLVQGVLQNGAALTARFLLGVVAVQAPLLTVYGSEGTLVLRGEDREPQIQMHPLQLLHAKRGAALEPMTVPDRFTRATATVPPGPPRSVAEHYLAIAAHWQGDASPVADFGIAVSLHKLLDVIRRASQTGQRTSL